MKKRSLLPGFLLVCFLQSMSAVDIAAQTVLTSECNVKQRTHYYPFGGIIPEYSTFQFAQPYKYNGKELDRMHGLDWYDYGARNYDAILGRWDRIDPLCEKYYHISPYVYCAGNPIRSIDVKGDSIAVLNMGGPVGHSAMLIQNKNGGWDYFSMNGDNIYKATNGLLGGKPYHDMGEKSFDNPQSFLQSDYNRTGTPDDIEKDKVNNYEFKEACIIPTSSEQDKTARDEFLKIAKHTNYNLLTNNCAQVVSKTLDKIGIKTYTESFNLESLSYERNYPIFPATLFVNVQMNNPNIRLLRRK